MLIYLYSPFPSAVDRIYRRIEREKVVHDEQREVLTAIAVRQLLIRSPVMESGGLLALLRSAVAGESREELGEGAVRLITAGALGSNAASRAWSRTCSRRHPRAPLGPGPGETADSCLPSEPGP